MTEERMRDVIDDYTSSIHTIIGFLNFYVYDDAAKANRSDVSVFQGRELYAFIESNGTQIDDETGDDRSLSSIDESTSLNSSTVDIIEDDNSGLAGRTAERRPVTPDLGVVQPDHAGVIGEVKITFPKDRSLWIQDFQQLKQYDAELFGWPTSSGRVAQHEIVLLTHQSRAVAVRDYYSSIADDGTIVFSRPFIIVECSRLEQRRQFYSFRVIEGSLSDATLQQRLHEGVQVPMDVLVKKYSTVKFYDAEPPLPYLMEAIWEHVVVPNVRSLPSFARLRKRERLDAVIQVAEILDTLVNGFSFRTFPNGDVSRQPQVPHRNWVLRACEQFVSSADAEWVDATKTSIRFFFQRFSSVLDHFIDVCTKPQSDDSDHDPQMRLF